MLILEDFGCSTGKIVSSKTCQSILSLPEDEVLEKFKSFGVLLFRGFGVTSEEIKAFSEKFSSKFVRDPSREIFGLVDDFVQLVDTGLNEVLPHSENSASPFRPDIVWFCCGVPPAQNGETLFWDGVKVWELLSEPVKQLFLSKRVKFRYHFPAETRKTFLGPESTIADVQQILSNTEKINYQIQEDESVDFEYISSVVSKTKFGDMETFTNNIVLYHQNKEMLEAVNSDRPVGDIISTFEDDSLISDAVVNEIMGVMDKLTNVISWQPGDLVMIDNSRFMHGRRAFQDTQRQIFSHLSYIKD